MAFFVAAGVISDEIVRKETRNGVLATFRLETGAPNNRRLWIDVEAWGQLAGTIAHHGSVGRGVLVSGRLSYKTWRDRETGDSRHRYVVTALDIDLLPDGSEPVLLPSTVVVAGTIETVYPVRPTKRGVVHSFRLSSGRAGSKTGRLWIDVDYWLPAGDPTRALPERGATFIAGQLGYRSSGDGPTGLYLRSTTPKAAAVSRQHFADG